MKLCFEPKLVIDLLKRGHFLTNFEFWPLTTISILSWCKIVQVLLGLPYPLLPKLWQSKSIVSSISKVVFVSVNLKSCLVCCCCRFASPARSRTLLWRSKKGPDCQFWHVRWWKVFPTTCEDYSPEITDIHLHFSKVAVSFGAPVLLLLPDGCNLLLARIPIL